MGGTARNQLGSLVTVHTASLPFPKSGRGLLIRQFLGLAGLNGLTQLFLLVIGRVATVHGRSPFAVVVPICSRRWLQ